MLINSSYGGAKAVTKSDTTVIVGSAIYVGGAGNVAVECESGDVVTFTAPPVGSIIPIRHVKVMSTNTTATLLLSLS